MTIINYHDIEELKNINEEKVWRAMEELLAGDLDLCRCRDCILDAAALALNSLPARYQVYSFHAYDSEDKDPDEETREAVAHALEQVKKKPHHF